MTDNSSILLKGIGRDTDQFTLAARKLENQLKATGAGLAYLTLKGIVNFAKASGRSAKSVEEQEQALSKLSTLQKFAQKRIFQHTRANRTLSETYAFLNQNTDEGNKHFMRMAMGLTSIVGSIFLLASGIAMLVLGIGTLVIAMQGQDNGLISATENYGLLHDAVLGLTEIFDPEGGLSNGIKAVGAALAVGAAVFVLVSGPVAVLVSGLLLAVYAFNLVKEKTGSLAAGMVAFGAVLGPFIAIIVAMSGSLSGIVVAVVNFLNVFSAASTVVSITTTSLMAGFALIVGGIMALVYVATGQGNMIKSLIMGLVGAVAVGAGLFVLGVAAIPAGIIAAVLLVFAFIIRKRKELYALLKGILSFFLNLMLELGKIVDKYNPVKKLGKLGGKLLNKIQARADGGPVTGGRPYLVGERGPELFTPSASGSITPNHQMGGGGGGQTINMTIDVSGVTDRTDKRDLAREIGDMINQELRRQGGATTRGRF